MKNARSFAFLVALLSGAGCHRAEPTISIPSNGPNQVLNNFELQEMQNGKKSMMLQAVQGRVYEADHHADLDNPFVTFYQNGQISSQMKAPIGKVDMETHAIEAWNGVTVTSADSSTLTTERLQYDPKRRKIISHAPVRLEKTDSVTVGDNIEADPDLTSVIITHQQVRIKRTPAKAG